MLYGNDSISYYSRTNMLIWITMAFQAGLLNMGGFMACHEFVSHVTGYITLFGSEVSKTRYDHALGMLAVPLLFLLGSMLSGQLVDLRLRLRKKPKYYLSFGIIFFLILLVLMGGELNFFGEFGKTDGVMGYVLLALLCLICGIQNGTVTSVSKAIVRTTHLTGVTTDLGIGIIRVLNRNNLKEDMEEENKANLMRVGIITAFGLGSVIGGLVFYRSGYAGFIVPTFTSGALFSGALYFQVLKSDSPRVEKAD